MINLAKFRRKQLNKSASQLLLLYPIVLKRLN
jgi:hypothetical protein